MVRVRRRRRARPARPRRPRGRVGGQGRVFAYERATSSDEATGGDGASGGEAWSLTQVLTPPLPGGRWLGYDIAVRASGDGGVAALITAPSSHAGGFFASGAAHAYVLKGEPGARWEHAAEMRPSDPYDTGYFALGASAWAEGWALVPYRNAYPEGVQSGGAVLAYDLSETVPVSAEGGPGPLAPEASGVAVSVGPSPARGRAVARVALSEPSAAVTVTVLDARGRAVRRVALGARGAGEHAAEIDLGGLAAGAYAVRVVASGGATGARVGGVAHARLVVVR